MVLYPFLYLISHMSHMSKLMLICIYESDIFTEEKLPTEPNVFNSKAKVMTLVIFISVFSLMTSNDSE